MQSCKNSKNRIFFAMSLIVACLISLMSGCSQKPTTPSDLTEQTDHDYCIDGLSYKRELIYNGYEVTCCEKCEEKEMVIPDSLESRPVTVIGDYAFSACEHLEKIILPSTVKSIGYRSFAGCKNLKDITLPSQLSKIGDFAFSGATAITSVSLPAQISSLGKFTFSGCSSLTSITIPANIQFIGDYAFYYCSNLTTITFEGTMAQWNAVSKGQDWDINTAQYTIYCTDGNIG